MGKRNYLIGHGYSNVRGTDDFALGLGSAGARVEQLKQALRILGASIDEPNFGMQTRRSLIQFGYQPSILNNDQLNKIILRAYAIGKKRIVLTEPQMRALWEKQVSPIRRNKVTFEKWLKRQGIKKKIGEGGKAVFDVLFGWLQMKARGAGAIGGIPADQAIDTSGGWFSKPSEGGIHPVVYIVGGLVGAGLLIWGVTVIAKKTAQSAVRIQQ